MVLVYLRYCVWLDKLERNRKGHSERVLTTLYGQPVQNYARRSNQSLGHAAILMNVQECKGCPLEEHRIGALVGLSSGLDRE